MKSDFEALIRRAAVNAIFDVLVRHGGAQPSLHSQFVHFMDEADDLREFRFQGKLGFGGKFRWNDGRIYVDCYPEDESRKRKTIIKKANAELNRLTKAERL